MSPTLAALLLLSVSASVFSALPASRSGVFLISKPDPEKPDESIISILPVTVSEQASSDNNPAVQTKPVNTILPFPLPDAATTSTSTPEPENNINVPILVSENHLRTFFNKTGFNITSLFGGLFSG